MGGDAALAWCLEKATAQTRHHMIYANDDINEESARSQSFFLYRHSAFTSRNHMAMRLTTEFVTRPRYYLPVPVPLNESWLSQRLHIYTTLFRWTTTQPSRIIQYLTQVCLLHLGMQQRIAPTMHQRSNPGVFLFMRHLDQSSSSFFDTGLV
ncbi:uncharacterized protein BDR25DRAFT_359720 [Lindgomyces ingoldianus]|uniref:Uncharacterized protein n=1 Tax=Lindgomyces ingoldianus TaxID=673940 RepID=A0ACB6QHA1_9PLEO|nr:uncharacterized protein BDR25DRAFT_359720 [Lindgomyces ingoldianus]KAF2466369.1 hypothetical protein BDR25DRAFT_359720 [Lindgomyces ingoldianus]